MLIDLAPESLDPAPPSVDGEVGCDLGPVVDQEHAVDVTEQLFGRGVLEEGEVRRGSGFLTVRTSCVRARGSSCQQRR